MSHTTARCGLWLFWLALLLFPRPALGVAPLPPAPQRIANTTDRLLAEHWRKQTIAPSAVSPGLLRRVTLDLVGRVPTVAEVDAFAADRSPDRYSATVRRLLTSPEFSWQVGTVLDEVIQSRYAGSEAFITYLRQSLRQRKGWDVLFREVMVGPWKDNAQKPARLFLERRAKNLDVLTVDTARSFFGVDISCARCHDHPLVSTWKQEHYYGLGAFFVRTTGGKGNIGEKNTGEAKFAGKDGKERTAAMRFLSNRVVQEPPPGKLPFSRREALVQTALEEQRFFARAFVNRLWEYHFGRGLVHPTDQMHPGNRPSVGGLLDRLADEFIAGGYDVQNLMHGLALSRAYQSDSRQERPSDPGDFAVARLRPLSPRQLARSLVLVLGDGSFAATPERLLALDKEASELLPMLDPLTGDFQSSASEALFLSNAEPLRKRIAASGTNLTARLSRLREEDAVRLAYRTILSRPPTREELGELSSWVQQQADRRAAVEDLVWALVTSAEFRFNH